MDIFDAKGAKIPGSGGGGGGLTGISNPFYTTDLDLQGVGTSIDIVI